MAGCAVLVVAAGRGSRMGGDIPKQWRELDGEPLLRHSIRALLSHPGIDLVQVVIHPDDRAFYDEAAKGFGRLAEPVAGGDTRRESVLNGLEALVPAAPDFVLIHDGARPFVSHAVIDRVMEALRHHEGAIPALRVHDTLKQAGPDGLIVATLPRESVWRAQTPQGFCFTAILAAHRAAGDIDMPDDAAIAEQAGLEVAVVEGEEGNFKITTEADMARAVASLDSGAETRMGSGFDVHPFAPGQAVTLCGVSIPHEAGLAGHSDADVGLHALTDALLGAIGAGDIGVHFPPSDPRWRGADSAVFLAHAADLVAARGGIIVNVDVTLICETPKISPHRAAMTARMSSILKIDEERVSVKATTTEGLGFTGRREGIAAQAAATITLRSRR